MLCVKYLIPVSDTNSGPVAPTPASLVRAPDGRLRSSGVAYADQWPVDLGTAAVIKSIRKGGGSWRSVTVFSEIASTNTVGVALASAGCPTGVVLVTDLQTAGRGRLDRDWEAPAGTSAMFSVVLIPHGPEHEWGVLPLLAGVAVCEALEFVTGIRASLKWPNDLVIRAEDAPSGRGGKVGGILAEPDLPVPGATSLTLAGASRPRRAKLIGRALSRIEHWFTAWEAVGTDAASLDRLLDSYRERCVSIDAPLSVARPGAEDLVGTGVGIAPNGALLVDSEGTQVAVVVGDVTHAVTT